MAVVEDAASKVSSFLSESRVLAERATLCKHSGCAYLCTGLAPSHCCRMCAKSPGAHGPKCAKKLLGCATPGCSMAVTGITEKYCCKMCGKNGQHGPNCWCLQMALVRTDEGEEEAEAEAEAEAETEAESASASSPEPTGWPLATVDEPSEPEPPDDTVATACAAAAHAWSKSESKMYDAKAGEGEPIDISDAEVAELETTVQANQATIATNMAIIQALREALNARHA